MAESTGNWTLIGCRKGKRWEARKRERTVASLPGCLRHQQRSAGQKQGEVCHGAASQEVKAPRQVQRHPMSRAVSRAQGFAQAPWICNLAYSMSPPLDLRGLSFRTPFETTQSPLKTPLTMACVVTFRICRGAYKAVSEWTRAQMGPTCLAVWP